MAAVNLPTFYQDYSTSLELEKIRNKIKSNPEICKFHPIVNIKPFSYIPAFRLDLGKEKKIYELNENTPQFIHHAEAYRITNITMKTSIKSNVERKKNSMILLIALTALSFTITLIAYGFIFLYAGIPISTIFSSLTTFYSLISLTNLIGLAALSIYTTYSICNYFKYKKKSKIQFENIKNNLFRTFDDPSKQNAIILYTPDHCDSNEAFRRTYVEVLGPLAAKYNLDVYYPISTNHIAKILESKLYHHPIIAAHGRPDLIYFTPNFNLTEEDIPFLNFSKLHPRANIILISCSTGSMNNGIGEKIASFYKRKVIAPTTKTIMPEIESTNEGSIKYKFIKKSKNFWKEDITREIDPEALVKTQLEFA